MFWLDIWYDRYSDDNDKTQTSFVCHTHNYCMWAKRKQWMSGTHLILFQQAVVLFKFTFYVSLLTIVKTLTSSDPGSRKLIVTALVIIDRPRPLETVFVLTDPRFSLESLFPHFLNSHFQFIISFVTYNIFDSFNSHHEAYVLFDNLVHNRWEALLPN